MLSAIKDSSAYIKSKIGDFEPQVGIILGTGLGGLVNEIEITHQISYTNIPHFPVSTLEFHAGKLIFGYLSGKKVVAMHGRLHFYEGYKMAQITFPLRVMKQLGIQYLFISNASGSLNPAIHAGDLMLINDHINLLPDNPLRGINDDALGNRFPDMSQPYDKTLLAKAQQIAQQHQITCHQGVYVSVMGPNLETKAEYKYLRLIGGDAVGMSTVPEVIVANHANLPVCAISVITDEGFHQDLKPVSIETIIEIANQVEPKLTLILKKLVASL